MEHTLASIDFSLAEKGRRESRRGIVDQLGYSIALYQQPEIEPALNRRGLTHAHFERMVGIRQALDSQESIRAEAADGSLQAAQREAAARNNLKSIKRDLDLSFVDLYADHKDLPVTREAFYAGEPLGNSTPRFSAYFARIDLPLQKITHLLANYNDGRDLHSEAREAKAELDEAQAAQEVGIRQLPIETQKMLALKGEALSLIERFNRAGKRAFDGDAVRIALFNKDLILRARKKVRTATKVEATEQSASA